MQTRVQFGIKQLLIAVAIVALLLGLARGLWGWIAGPVVPKPQLQQLRPGMMKSEVRSILGNPQIIEDDDRTWVYLRWGNPGWVEVYFDVNGRFDSVNDESPFP
ncbi:MAG: outer membrane protein assembly factor BamE [Pirellulales bacterium]|nr:outer membrane protein assembly factor BamE [Pirellulales bacterium]